MMMMPEAGSGLLQLKKASVLLGFSGFRARV